MQYDFYRIEREITARGETAEHFLKSVGISMSVFEQWKNSKRIPKTEQIQSIANRLNIPIARLTISDDAPVSEEVFDLSKAFESFQNAGFNVSKRKTPAKPLTSPYNPLTYTAPPEQEPQPKSIQQSNPVQVPKSSKSSNIPAKKSDSTVPPPPRSSSAERKKQQNLSHYSVVCPRCKQFLPSEKRTVSVERKEIYTAKVGYCSSCGQHYTDDDALRFKDTAMGDVRIYWSNLRYKSGRGKSIEFTDKLSKTKNQSKSVKLLQYENTQAAERKRLEREKKHLATQSAPQQSESKAPDFELNETITQLPILESTNNSCTFCKRPFGKMLTVKYLVFSDNDTAHEQFTSARSCPHCKAFFLDHVQYQQVQNQTSGKRVYTIHPSKFATAKDMMLACLSKPEPKPISKEEYTPLPFEDRINTTENLSAESKIVQVYANKCHCHKCSEKYQQNTIRNRTAVVQTVNGKAVDVNVMFCMGCGQYFINIKALEQYKKLYGGLLFEYTLSSDLIKSQFSWFDFAPDSVLSRCGYTVKEGVSREYRQAILRYILETGKASKFQIIELISSFIDWRAGRPQYEGACDRWQEDIQFVSNYQIQRQTKVYGMEFVQAGKIR